MLKFTPPIIILIHNDLRMLTLAFCALVVCACCRVILWCLVKSAAKLVKSFDMTKHLVKKKSHTPHSRLARHVLLCPICPKILAPPCPIMSQKSPFLSHHVQKCIPILPLPHKSSTFAPENENRLIQRVNNNQ